MNMGLNEFKYETVISPNMKLLFLTSNKSSYSYDQLYADLIKWPILESPEKFSCITIHQTCIFPDPQRRHYSSD